MTTLQMWMMTVMQVTWRKAIVWGKQVRKRKGTVRKTMIVTVRIEVMRRKDSL